MKTLKPGTPQLDGLNPKPQTKDPPNPNLGALCFRAPVLKCNGSGINTTANDVYLHMYMYTYRHVKLIYFAYNLPSLVPAVAWPPPLRPHEWSGPPVPAPTSTKAT